MSKINQYITTEKLAILQELEMGLARYDHNAPPISYKERRHHKKGAILTYFFNCLEPNLIVVDLKKMFLIHLYLSLSFSLTPTR